MKFYLEVLHRLDDKDKNGLIITKEEFPTKQKLLMHLKKKKLIRMSKSVFIYALTMNQKIAHV